MTYTEIIYTVEDHVALITFNRPARMNALTSTTHKELAAAIQDAAGDEEVRVLVLTGAGKGFCSGDDVGDIFLSKDMDEFRGREARLKMLQGKHMAGGGHGLLEINKPSIAAVNGAAVGYGCDIALMCNMRVASERAKFGEIFLRVGLIPDQGLILLPRLIGLAKAYEMILTTDIIDAAEAERIGLVNRVVPHDDLLNSTMELARKIATKPPIAVQLAMEGIRRGLALAMEPFLEFHSQAMSLCAETEDHAEGARAFAEKRRPVFRGR